MEAAREARVQRFLAREAEAKRLGEIQEAKAAELASLGITLPNQASEEI